MNPSSLKRGYRCAKKLIYLSLQRLMLIGHSIANERRHNFYGFNGARLAPSQSVRDDKPSREKISWLMRLLSPILFYAPDTQWKKLQGIWVDGKLKDRNWKIFSKKIETDWNEFVLYVRGSALFLPFDQYNNDILPFSVLPVTKVNGTAQRQRRISEHTIC